MSQGFLRRESLLLVGTAILCLIAFISARRYSAVVSQLDNLGITAARADVQDRLMGTLVDISRLNTNDEEWHQLANGKPLIIWVADLERCDACLATIGDWKRSECVEKPLTSGAAASA